MGRVFAAFGFQPEPLQHAIVLRLQLHQRRDRRDGRDHGARLFAAERQQPVETKLERAAMHAPQHAGDLIRQRVVDIADEAQREMIIFGIDPAGPRQTAPHHGQRAADRRWNLNTGEQTGHDDLRLQFGAHTGNSQAARRMRGSPRVRNPQANLHDGFCARTCATSCSTFGNIRATITPTPAALGCSPSCCVRLRSAAAPSRKKG